MVEQPKARFRDVWRFHWTGRRRQPLLVGFLLALGFIVFLSPFPGREEVPSSSHHPRHPLDNYGTAEPSEVQTVDKHEVPSSSPRPPSRPNLYVTETSKPQTVDQYVNNLESFIKQAFPKSLHARLQRQLRQHAVLDEPMDIPHSIWQTDKVLPQFTKESWENKNPEWKWSFMNDEQLDVWARETLQGSEIEWIWRTLPMGVMRSDLWRYLILLLEGGVYSDSDTICLKPISKWGAGALRWGESLADQLPAMIVGVEADTVNNPDTKWAASWSRRLQINQWTIMASPGHPVLLDAIRRIYSTSIKLERLLIEQSKHDLDESQLQKLRKDALLDQDDWLSVVEWTGPAIFTDSVHAYLTIKYRCSQTALHALRTPLKVGAMTILPVTGFSPGVGLFDAEGPDHPEAMASHLFWGSWKLEGNPRAHLD